MSPKVLDFEVRDKGADDSHYAWFSIDKLEIARLGHVRIYVARLPYRPIDRGGWIRGRVMNGKARRALTTPLLAITRQGKIVRKHGPRNTKLTRSDLREATMSVSRGLIPRNRGNNAT